MSYAMATIVHVENDVVTWKLRSHFNKEDASFVTVLINYALGEHKSWVLTSAFSTLKVNVKYALF